MPLPEGITCRNVTVGNTMALVGAKQFIIEATATPPRTRCCSTGRRSAVLRWVASCCPG